MPHYPGHLIIGVAAFAATLLISTLTPNRLVRRKLTLSLFLFGGYVLLHPVLLARPDLSTPGSEIDQQLRAIEHLVLAAGFINIFVLALLNPFTVDRVPDRFPSILQDAIVIGLLVIVATFVFKDKLLTTSAVGAVVVGFALQETLGNAFAGLAIQTEKPFRVGEWIRVGEFEGRVTEITWRATKLRTKAGNFVIVPNNTMAREAITNYSEPLVPTRLEVDVGVSYGSPPNEVKDAIRDALMQVPSVLTLPPPDVLLHSFDASSIGYRARFWVEDYERDEQIRDQVRTAIYYGFGRRNIEIPYPIQVEYGREWPEPDPAARAREREDVLSRVDLFARLSAEQRAEIAASTVTHRFGDGEAIVRQGMPGQSLFVVCSGTVAVVIEPGAREVATIERGGYFGEMSLLTGDARTATVVARGDTVVLELDADVFRSLGAADPQAVEQVAVAAIARRAELEQARDAARAAAIVGGSASLLARVKKFLRLR
ncbi:MAG TPA: mechanosensitive ion channel family protein [Vicinamibacterales bacterium]|jgi:small-conductance mechanosensitive channel|nr:mechanosensitive ion channel family protein [Vicinamibacterales bacterium]